MNAIAPTLSSHPLAGRTCVVTGGTSGIGEVCARHLAAAGARVLLVGRSPERGEATLGRIRRQVPDADLHLLLADLSRLAEVRRLATEVRQSTDRLDVLINNAGAIFYERALTPDGNERTFALNVLAPFLLTELLRDRLEAARGRVINVASAAHRGGRLHLDDLDRSHGYSAFGAYDQSKLAILLLTYEAARRYAGLGATFNACHPGFIRSRFGDDGRTITAHLLRGSKRLFGSSSERGARTLIYLASTPDLGTTTGAYFVGDRPHRSSRASHDRETARRLWGACLDRTAPYRAPRP